MLPDNDHLLPLPITHAYNTDVYGIGFSPVIQYGTLMISYNGYNSSQSSDSHTGYSANLGGY